MVKTYKEIKFGKEAREKMLIGIEKLANAVCSTLGAKGKNVIIGTKYGVNYSTNDGVTVAKEFSLKDIFENIGSNIVKEVAINTNRLAGDGTTTSIQLAYTIIKSGMELINSGMDGVELKRNIEIACKDALELLKKYSKDVDSIDEIRTVATISANNDEEIGNLIADAMEEVGNYGILVVDESGTSKTFIEYVRGLQYDSGFLSPYFINNTQKGECVFENPFVFVTDRILRNVQEVLPLLQLVHNTQRPLVIIGTLEGDALNLVIQNVLQQNFPAVVTKPPKFGEKQKQMLEDICFLTGATFFNKDLPYKASDVVLEHLGTADKIKIDKDFTTLYHEKVEGLIDYIENLKNTKMEDEGFKKERIAKLTNGVAIIKVGASSEFELREKKARAEDAVSSIKSAVDEGIITGGGLIPLIIANKLWKVDENPGYNILFNGLESLMERICDNAGLIGSEIIKKVVSKDFKEVYNVKTGEWEKANKSNIFDPVKVIRVALENAVSVASLFLTTDTVMIDLEG